MQTTTISNGKSIYEVGLNELHVVTNDETLHKKIDNDFREARGREGARLHVTLQALSEADRRAQENTQATLNAIATLTAELTEKSAQLTHLVQSFEATADKRFTGVHEQISGFWQAENEHFNTMRTQVGQFENAISTQTREATERLAVDLRKLRDEVVSLIDSRMNQSDAAFAAVRGDVEVVKFLVMDLIKDRIGRTDPKQKPF
jgi:ElaB/YqjD/DUF883 family membrane-anchored ribosome-binding protein